MARWHQREWRGYSPGVPLTRRIQRLNTHLQTGALPNTWVAQDNKVLVGSVSLVDYVFREESEASAWVANLFVVPWRRRQGLGTCLLAFAESEAARLDLKRLFLFTPDSRDFYLQHHWVCLHQVRVQGQWVDLMTKSLGCYQEAFNDTQNETALARPPTPLHMDSRPAITYPSINRE